MRHILAIMAFTALCGSALLFATTDGPADKFDKLDVEVKAVFNGGPSGVTVLWLEGHLPGNAAASRWYLVTLGGIEIGAHGDFDVGSPLQLNASGKQLTHWAGHGHHADYPLWSVQDFEPDERHDNGLDWHPVDKTDYGYPGSENYHGRKPEPEKASTTAVSHGTVRGFVYWPNGMRARGVNNGTVHVLWHPVKSNATDPPYHSITYVEKDGSFSCELNEEIDTEALIEVFATASGQGTSSREQVYLDNPPRTLRLQFGK